MAISASALNVSLSEGGDIFSSNSISPGEMKIFSPEMTSLASILLDETGATISNLLFPARTKTPGLMLIFCMAVSITKNAEVFSNLVKYAEISKINTKINTAKKYYLYFSKTYFVRAFS